MHHLEDILDIKSELSPCSDKSVSHRAPPDTGISRSRSWRVKEHALVQIIGCLMPTLFNFFKVLIKASIFFDQVLKDVFN